MKDIDNVKPIDKKEKLREKQTNIQTNVKREKERETKPRVINGINQTHYGSFLDKKKRDSHSQSNSNDRNIKKKALLKETEISHDDSDLNTAPNSLLYSNLSNEKESLYSFTFDTENDGVNGDIRLPTHPTPNAIKGKFINHKFQSKSNNRNKLNEKEFKE